MKHLLRLILLLLVSPHVSLCQRIFPAPNGDFVIKEIKLPHGNGQHSAFEDPDLIEKPAIKGNHRLTSPVVILFDTGEVGNATVSADQREGKTVSEAIAIAGRKVRTHQWLAGGFL